MTDPSFPMQFKDGALEEARRMGRGPRLEPLRYEPLRIPWQSLSDHATPYAPGA